MKRQREFYQASYDKHHDHKHDHCHHCGKSKCECEKGALVEEVLCSKDVQKTAEFILPATLGPLGEGGALDPTAIINALLTILPVDALVNITVTPNFENIEQEVTVIRDKVINMGFIPATLDVETALGVIELRIPIRIFFQEHTDVPGVCPGDEVIETTPEVEAVFSQPLIATTETGATVINLLLFKAIVRTHMTVIRRGVKRNGKVEPLDKRRCEPTATPVTINNPQNLTGNTQSFSLTPPV